MDCLCHLLVFMGIFSIISYMKKWNLKSSIKIFNWKWILCLSICFIIIVGAFFIYLKKGNVLELLSEDLNWRIPVEQKLSVRLPLWKHYDPNNRGFPYMGSGYR